MRFKFKERMLSKESANFPIKTRYIYFINSYIIIILLLLVFVLLNYKLYNLNHRAGLIIKVDITYFIYHHTRHANWYLLNYYHPSDIGH